MALLVRADEDANSLESPQMSMPMMGGVIMRSRVDRSSGRDISPWSQSVMALDGERMSLSMEM